MIALAVAPLWGLEGTKAARPMTYSPTTSPHYGYMEYLPPGYSSGGSSYPLVIFLHGIGERGNGTSELYKVEIAGPPKLIKNGRDFPAIVISPQAPPSGVGWFWHKYVVDLIRTCQQRYRVDANRIYVTGLSAGGGTTWSLAENWPGLVAAIAPICGAADPDPIIKAASLRRVPVWAFHNTDDTTVYPSKTRNWMNAIVKASTGLNDDVMASFPGFPSNSTSATASTASYSAGRWNWASGVLDRSLENPAMYTLYAKGGHDSWTKTYANDTFWEWLFRQRNTAPSISGVSDRSVGIGGSTGDLAFAVNDAQLSPDYLTVTATSSNTAVVPAANVVVGGSGGSRTVRIACAGAGSSTITLTVSDGILRVPTSFSVSSGAAELIVDNRDAVRVTTSGGWSLTAFSPGFYASDYLVAVPGSACIATFRPNLASAGWYEVAVRYPANSARGIAPVSIHHGDGTSVHVTQVDQRQNGGCWFPLGTFALPSGPLAAVTIGSQGAGGYVSADAVRFRPVAALPAVNLIIDNNDASRVTMVGNWTSTTVTAGYFGADYFSAAPDTANRVVYRPNLANNGFYRIYMWYPAASGRGTTPVTIRSKDGSQVDIVAVDQRFNGGKWNLLGSFQLDGGSGPSVTIGSYGSGGWIGADAIRFEEAAVGQ